MVGPPEKRKVGGSTPPLTTPSEQERRPERSSFGAFLISSDSNADSNVTSWERDRVDATPYLNRTAFTLFLDTNIIGSIDQPILTLLRLREEGWINLQRTDTMDTEFLKAAPDKRADLTEESSRVTSSEVVYELTFA